MQTKNPPHLYFSFNLKQCAIFGEGLLEIDSWITVWHVSLSVLHTKSCLEHGAVCSLPLWPSPCQTTVRELCGLWMDECMLFLSLHCQLRVVKFDLQLQLCIFLKVLALFLKKIIYLVVFKKKYTIKMISDENILNTVEFKRIYCWLK